MDGIGIGMGWDGSPGGRGYRAPYGANKPLEVCQLQSARQASGWNESESYAFSPIWDELNTSNSFFPKIQHQRHDHWSATLDHPRTIVTTLNINIAPFFLLIFSHLTGPENKVPTIRHRKQSQQNMFVKYMFFFYISQRRITQVFMYCVHYQV